LVPNLNLLCLVVDSRVRVQLGPLPVNHEKNTNRLNKWFRFIKIKRGNM